MSIQTKRAYDPPAPDDGRRYLIDRLWPRGVSKEQLALRAWRKDLAPSDSLRRWFGHNPVRFSEFRRRYRAELLRDPDALEALRAEARRSRITLVFGARDAEHSNASVLRELLEEGAERTADRRGRTPPPDARARSRPAPPRKRS